MTQKSKRKFLVYVDESGQDTKGAFFVVSIVILQKDRERITKILEHIEKTSGKKNKKWNKTSFEYRKIYFDMIAKNLALRNILFFKIYAGAKKYIELTSNATAQAILVKAPDENYNASIFVDGLRKREMEVFARGLRKLGVKRRKIRGVKKEENNIFIRLADASCGLVRDAYENDAWAMSMMKKLVSRGNIKAL